MCAIVGRNLKVNSLRDTLRLYSGDTEDYYYSVVNNYAKEHNLTISENNCRYYND